MMTWRTLLEAHIKKLTSPLKEEKVLIMILKKRLTKKEFKILSYMVEGIPQKEQCEKLLLDEERYEKVKTKALKKINFNDLKEELLTAEVL